VSSPGDSGRLVQPGRLLVTQAGGYFRNPVRDSSTCTVCTTPIESKYDRCFACEERRGRFGSELADHTAFLAYAIKGEQSGAVMHRYKWPRPPSGPLQAVTLLAANGLLRHTACLDRIAALPVTHWTAVPSLKGRDGVHPLRTLVGPYVPGRELTSRTEVTAGLRTTDPGSFDLDRLSGPTHLLVIDDTWVSGSHAQSLAVAAHRAGAAQVSVLSLTRWLNPDFGGTRPFLGRLNETFDPALCPWSGFACPT
jgi:predicted amidophosphoribosyltransferase